MGISKLKIPKICEYCEKSFEAKTVTTRFCSPACGNKSGKDRKQQVKNTERKQTILEQSASKIAILQTRPFLSISEATMMFGISKDTIRRLIKTGKIPAFNLGTRLTRVSRQHMEAMFTAIPLPEKPKEQPVKLQYETSECYTIAEVSEKFEVSLSTVSNTIRRNSIPKRQVGKFVYVPKELIDKIFSDSK
ncbi:helix-turn-helix domain-containing protein [Dysgonomonas sp. GY617]|uniref:helix-turn-helix domain-containing protein n=1 Tax=Dysgonomonas sp. GY617 TaxID=2780420 RepID=UPI001883754D|nr:helix-turn-helix domain-containing protein [Dysgonomonas sp. GY617]MBF0577203.1 helix-turn-helix domain-containing protein [Dysgonomonas sp. GY617]